MMIPDYTIQCNGQEVKFIFNTRALRLYCQAHKLELAELYQKVHKAFLQPEEITDELKEVKDFTVTDLPNLLYYGNESWCAYNGEAFNVNELTKDLWIDAIGGIQEQKDAFTMVLVAIAQRMVAPGEKKRMNETPTAAEVGIA